MFMQKPSVKPKKVYAIQNTIQKSLPRETKRMEENYTLCRICSFYFNPFSGKLLHSNISFKPEILYGPLGMGNGDGALHVMRKRVKITKVGKHAE